MKGYLTSDEAAARLGVTRQSLYNMANRHPDFPKPKKFGHASMWSQAKLDAWRRKHPSRKR